MAGLSLFSTKARSRIRSHTSNPRAFRRHSLLSESVFEIITTPGLCAIYRRDVRCGDGWKKRCLLLANTHRASEPDVGCGLIRPHPVAKENGHAGCLVRPSATADHLVHSGLRPFRISGGAGLVILTIEPVRTPLRDV